MQCNYGCDQEAKYLLKNGKQCCSKSSNSCPKMRAVNSRGVRATYSEGTRQGLIGFSEESRIKSIEAKIERLKKRPFEDWGDKLRRGCIDKEQGGQCLICGVSEWLGSKLNLHLDHIDGNNLNNQRSNLRLICPNCHSQTSTYCGKNINSGKVRITDDEIMEALGECGGIIRRALIKLGLTPKGGNYSRVHKLIELRSSGEIGSTRET